MPDGDLRPAARDLTLTGDTEPNVSPVVINIGGEGEIPGALNVNGKWVGQPGWQSMRPGNPTLADLEAQGHVFLITDMHPLPFADHSVDVVYSNNVCFDFDTWLGPCPLRYMAGAVSASGGGLACIEADRRLFP